MMLLRATVGFRGSSPTISSNDSLSMTCDLWLAEHTAHRIHTTNCTAENTVHHRSCPRVLLYSAVPRAYQLMTAKFAGRERSSPARTGMTGEGKYEKRKQQNRDSQYRFSLWLPPCTIPIAIFRWPAQPVPTSILWVKGMSCLVFQEICKWCLQPWKILLLQWTCRRVQAIWTIRVFPTLCGPFVLSKLGSQWLDICRWFACSLSNPPTYQKYIQSSTFSKLRSGIYTLFGHIKCSRLEGTGGNSMNRKVDLMVGELQEVYRVGVRPRRSRDSSGSSDSEPESWRFRFQDLGVEPDRFDSILRFHKQCKHKIPKLCMFSRCKIRII